MTLLTTKQLAKALNITEATLRRHYKKPNWPKPVSLSKRTFRWDLNEVLAALTNK